MHGFERASLVSMKLFASAIVDNLLALPATESRKLFDIIHDKNLFDTDSFGLSAAVISCTAGIYLYFAFVSRSGAYD